MSLQKIVVCGSPHSGKTTVSIKLAKLIEKKYKNSVMIVFAQDKGSPMTYAFLKKESVGSSLGGLVTKPDITEQDIIDAMLLPGSSEDVSCLGYRIGESFGMFPKIDESQVSAFYKILSNVVDYVIVDTSNDFDHNLLSRVAIEQFDDIVYVCGADVASLSYYKSALPIIKDITDREPKMVLLNDVKAFAGLPVVKEQMGTVDYVLPYEVGLLEQSLEGRMSCDISIKKRKRNFNYILDEVIDELIYRG